MSCQRNTRRKIAHGASPYSMPKQSTRFSKYVLIFAPAIVFRFTRIKANIVSIFLGDDIITFRVGDGLLPIKVHKNVICEKLEVFDAMLRGNFSEATSKVIDLPEDDFHTFELLVQWCYTNRISMPDSTTSYEAVGQRVELYCLAHKYCALVLQDFVTNYIITWLRMNEHRTKIVDPAWIARIERTFTATYDELAGLDGLPGPLRFLIGFVNKMTVLASKPGASELAVMRFANFRSRELEHWGCVFSEVPSIRRYVGLSGQSDAEITEELNPSSTACCEYHTHSRKDMLECPLFKDLKGSAKYSPDAFVIVTHLKRLGRMAKEIEKYGFHGSSLPRDGPIGANHLILHTEFDMNGNLFTKAQELAGFKELTDMGIISEPTGIRRNFLFLNGNGLENL
ncbi:847a6801-eb57-49fd-bc29-46525bcb55b2-CDS [Sclerotinia trifoliorum]|uniref:847a6801-eb57-49fd-bc29-46525bcb55b2-CDS n=1 Tax=Sclerotinia trifoliorum TaxID=28548 RepID=A0A8H2VXM2_9HELO|nr:847a6801-eb57-49fd-bc29-46525bcb55b2-CDS [Sclerotinia trifoliorum]